MNLVVTFDSPLFPEIRENDKSHLLKKEFAEKIRLLHALRTECWKRLLRERSLSIWKKTPIAAVLREHGLSKYRRPDSIAKIDNYNEALLAAGRVCNDPDALEYVDVVRRLRARLVSANLGLVRHAVRSFQFFSEDAWQEGVIGLLKAVDRFDPDRGLLFSTYATYWIRHLIYRYQKSQTRSVRIPSHVWGDKKKLNRLLKHTQTVNIDDVHTLRASTDHLERVESFMDVEATGIREALDALPSKLKTIIKGRFFDDKPKTLQQIGDDFGFSRERIRQLQNVAIERLRMHLENRRETHL